MQAPARAFRDPAKPLAAGMLLMAFGVLAVVAAIGADRAASLQPGFVPYCAGALYLAVLAMVESRRRRSADSLPAWLSPPALIAGWAVAWIYGPAAMAFLDDELLDELALAQGGYPLLGSGLLLACVAVTTLWGSYHLTCRLVGTQPDSRGSQPRDAALPRIVALYLLSAVARVLRVSVLGVAFGADFTGWGALAAADQWIGYAEDLRYLALALLVAHVVRQESGRMWLILAIAIEVLFAATSGFIKPFIWPVIVCVATAAALDRLRPRHVAVVAISVVVIASFMNVVTAIREDWRGGIGTGSSAGLGSTIAASLRGSGGEEPAVEAAYRKFFGRQTEVATSTGLVVALTPTVLPYEGFHQFLLLPTKLIPRALWPDKPVLSRGQWFSVHYRGLDEDTTSSSAMTMFGEGYLFYGWTGACLAMVLVGGILALLYRGLNRAALYPVYLALLPTVLEIEPELSSYVTSLVQRSIVFTIVFLILTHRSLKRVAVTSPA